MIVEIADHHCLIFLLSLRMRPLCHAIDTLIVGYEIKLSIIYFRDHSFSYLVGSNSFPLVLNRQFEFIVDVIFTVYIVTMVSVYPEFG